METIGERIRAVRKSAKATQKDFGARLNMSENFIWMIEKGQREPSDRTIADICRVYGIDEVWLRTGAGEPYRPKGREEELTELMAGLMADRPEAFRSRLITALLRFDPEGAEWAALERIYESVAQEAKKEHGG